MAANPHHVPGMGFIKNNPMPRQTAAGLEKVACRTKCGEVELKITLTPKFLMKPLREALVEPFLKVHNKRAAAPVSWEQIQCIKIDSFPLDNLADAEVTPCERFLTKEDMRVVLITNPSATLLDALLEVARETEEITYENYHNPPQPPMTHELIRIAQAASDVEGSPPDTDALRRATNAFEAVSGGAAAVNGAQVRTALLRDEYVRNLCFPTTSVHTRVLTDKVRRMAVGAGEPSVEQTEFSRFFVALSAAACAPAAAAEEAPPPGARKKKKDQGAQGFLEQLMDDDSVNVKRIH